MYQASEVEWMRTRGPGSSRTLGNPRQESAWTVGECVVRFTQCLTRDSRCNETHQHDNWRRNLHRVRA